MKSYLLAIALFLIHFTHAQNVGIGTTTPSQKLDVRGKTTDDSVLITVGNADKSHQLGLYGGRLHDPNPSLIWKAGDSLRFGINLNGFSELMRIMSNGNVGIGTPLPDLAKLQVQGMVGNTVAMFAGSSTSQGVSIVADWPGIFFNGYFNNGFKTMSASGYSSVISSEQSNGDMTFYLSDVANTSANSTMTLPERMRITSSGKVSIGTSAPAASAILDVSSTTQGVLPPRMTTAQRNAIANPATGLTIYNSSNNAFEVYNGTAWYSTVHYIGEHYGGGIVFYVYDNGQHGLVADTADQNDGVGIKWICCTYFYGYAKADGVGAGLKNTSLIGVAQGNLSSTIVNAANLCNEYSPTVGGVTYGDWYLPSIHELQLLYSQRAVVGGFANATYWSSNEIDNTQAWAQSFTTGVQNVYAKYSTYLVRAIRAF
jgi:hypothetical protein